VTSYVKCEYRVCLMLSDLRKMSGVSLSDANQAYWQEVSKKCNKAVVFIENSAAEWYDDQLMPAFDTDHKLELIVAPLLVQFALVWWPENSGFSQSSSRIFSL
jgi:hypothetical protein